MAKTDSKSAFLSAANKAAEGKAWKKFKDAKDGKFEDPQIEDGKYLCAWEHAKVGVSKKGGKPWIEFAYIVKSGPAEGTSLRNFFYDCFEDDGTAERLSKSIQRLGYEVSDMSPKDLVELVDDLNKEKPDIWVTCQNKEGDDGENRLRVYIDGKDDGSGDDDSPPKKKHAKTKKQ